MARQIAIELMLIAAIGLALAALGPFGSYAAPFGERAVHWIGFIVAGYAIFRPILVVAGWVAERLGIGRLAAQLIGVAIAALPFSFLVALALDRLLPAGIGPSPELYLQVCGIGVAVTLIMNRVMGPARPASVPVESETETRVPPQPPRPRFLDRVPAGVGPRLLCLSMEDHYVRAHGADGSALILMRLRDAIEELDGLPGLQVHRSWWVAAEAVERVERDGERMRLRLVNGLTVPVARSQIGAVRARRWRQE